LRCEIRPFTGFFGVYARNLSKASGKAAMSLGNVALLLGITAMSLGIVAVPLGIMALPIGIVAVSIGKAAMSMGIVTVPMGIMVSSAGITARAERKGVPVRTKSFTASHSYAERGNQNRTMIFKIQYSRAGVIGLRGTGFVIKDPTTAFRDEPNEA
jgi:hypothetical protein